MDENRHQYISKLPSSSSLEITKSAKNVEEFKNIYVIYIYICKSNREIFHSNIGEFCKNLIIFEIIYKKNNKLEGILFIESTVTLENILKFFNENESLLQQPPVIFENGKIILENDAYFESSMILQITNPMENDASERILLAANGLDDSFNGSYHSSFGSYNSSFGSYNSSFVKIIKLSQSLIILVKFLTQIELDNFIKTSEWKTFLLEIEHATDEYVQIDEGNIFGGFEPDPQSLQRHDIISLDRDLETVADIIEHIHRTQNDNFTELSQAYKERDWTRTPGGFWRFQIYLPKAKNVRIVGEFNNWNTESHPCHLSSDGYWNLVTDDKALHHGSRTKVYLQGEDDKWRYRISPYSRWVCRSQDNVFDSLVYHPPGGPFQFKYSSPPKPKTSLIYEIHIGVFDNRDNRISSYVDAQERLLNRIKKLGYNTIVVMGVVNHSYFPCLGKEATNYYAISERQGSPEDFKNFVDCAHKLELTVLIDAPHDCAASDDETGISDSCFDGYFLEGSMGYLLSKDVFVFDYSKKETKKLLLGSIAHFMTEYKVDGFRFLDVTSMIYNHHGVNRVFTGDYRDYLRDINQDAIGYLKLANDLIHYLSPLSLTIAVDQSKMPILCYPTKLGGVGFDYRQTTRQSDIWCQILKNNESDWSMSHILQTTSFCNPPDSNNLSNQRVIGCCESSDSCIKGKRPLKIAFFSWESLHTFAVGGVAPHVTELAAGLSRLGHEVHVFVRGTEMHSSHKNILGVHYHEVIFKLDRDFVKEMCNMCEAFVEAMVETEKFTGEDFQVTHAHDWLAANALAATKDMGRIAIQTMHSTEFGRCGNQTFGGQSSRIRDIESSICHKADRVICVSGVLASEVSGMYCIHPDKIKAIYNGIHCEHFDGIINAGNFKESIGIGSMDPTFLFVGRLVVQKGPDLLLRAVPMILSCRADAKFLFVGDGHMMTELRQISSSLSVSHAVKFLGKREGPELKNIFKSCDAVVVPSRNEPFGIVVLEAWSAHKPVVATTCGGPRDFVTPSQDGWLVDPTPESIAWGCCEILQNFEHSRWMGNRGRVKAAFSFSWDKIAKQTSEVYYEQLNRHDDPYLLSHFGDCCLSFRLMGDSIYHHMGVFDQDAYIARGIALHKMIRLFTLSSSQGYLNFMGNEFGCPDMIEMPCASNGLSHEKTGRRWELPDRLDLKYKHLDLFDSCMCLYSCNDQKLIKIDEDHKVISFCSANFVLLFNFHPDNEWKNYRTGYPFLETIKLILDTDETRFGGHNNYNYLKNRPIGENQHYDNFDWSFEIDILKPRTALLFIKNSSNDVPKDINIDADEFQLRLSIS
eukprot:GHVL01038353.1.p1 GENE.GHVL01038353.1~~GHVL01038353.1.p1  ORF type:complete len:1325 (+),score=240.19 GHVL01038353.1:30-3977(+)